MNFYDGELTFPPQIWMDGYTLFARNRIDNDNRECKRGYGQNASVLLNPMTKWLLYIQINIYFKGMSFTKWCQVSKCFSKRSQMRSNGTGFHHSLHQTSLVRRTRSLELQMGCSTDFVIVPVCFQMSAKVVGTTVKIRASKRDRSIKTATFVILYTNNVDRVVWTMKPRIHAWLNLAQAAWLTSQCCWICATLCLRCTCACT